MKYAAMKPDNKKNKSEIGNILPIKVFMISCIINFLTSFNRYKVMITVFEIIKFTQVLEDFKK